MTLLVMEGFDTRAPKSGWSFPNVSFTAGRFGGYQVLATSGNVTTTPSVNVSELIAGCAIFPDLTAPRILCRLISTSNVEQLEIRTLPTGAIEVRRGTSTVIATSSSGFLSNAVYAYLEIRATLDDTSGVVEIRVNGATAVNFTGDTRVSGSDTQFSQLSFISGSQTPVDDFYLLDTTGSAPYNTFLGEVKIETLVPNGNGAFSQLLGSDGNSTDNYLLVDENPASMSDYVESSTLGQRDTYTFSNPSTASGQVFAVQACAYVSKTDAGPANIKIIERASAGPTERLSFAIAVSNATWKQTGPMITDPNNATWSIATVSSAEFGVEVA